ncbi:nicastrin-like [Homarus americanus]|uniref:Nicastrin n=1 Tax=Homarus americanus TaxID=6706 RepID=A0A8J5NAM4_HOMAM|nr:nicastrin-like [Homarus americanus]KAG7176038.1 Nicastrin-like [Homarus americanus]
MAAVVSCVNRLLAHIFVLLVVLMDVNGNRVKHKIYEDIQGDMACFKRFNGTQEIGCTSKFSGNIGVVHVVESKEDLVWVYQRGPHQPYVLAITPRFLTSEVLKEAQNSGKVSGVVVMVEENKLDLPGGFSGETHCPNHELGLYNDSSQSEYSGYCWKEPWNPNGTSLLYMSWSFPIFLIDNETSINNIRDYYKTFNEPGTDGEPRSWPLCCMELKSNMFGTTNTEVCMRRRTIATSVFQPVNFCDPLSDYNIWGSVKPMNSSEVTPEKSVIIVAARMDAATMFDNISPGANSAISGMVTLLAAAGALYNLKDDIMKSEVEKNVLFVLYQGETWGYIGSSRMVWNMEKGDFPFKHQEDETDQISQMNLTHIDSFIELAQVGQGMTPVGSHLFLHTDPISNVDPEIGNETDTLLNLLEKYANSSGNVKFERANGDAPLPPASFQSFLKRVNISGVVITDHRDEFKNSYYESIFDDYRNVKYTSENESQETDMYHKHISRVAGVLASALYTRLTGNSKVIKADEKLTDDLLYCYMKNFSCQMFRDYGDRLPRDLFSDKPAKMYVSVKGGEGSRTTLTHLVFAKLLGEKVELNETKCKTESLNQVHQLYYFASLNNGTCVMSTVRKTEAMSPAFLIKDYNWQSGEYSTWTESGWQLTKAMIFLKPSVAEEVGLVCGGIASLLLSLALVYFMNSRADLLFGLTTPPAPC